MEAGPGRHHKKDPLSRFHPQRLKSDRLGRQCVISPTLNKNPVFKGQKSEFILSLNDSTNIGLVL